MINIPKGTKDMLPADSYKWHAVEAVARSVARRYNVKQIRTPVFESAELYLRSIGDETDIVNKEMYIFEDKRGRRLALRPEGTAGVVRSFVENNLGETLPLKVFYIESLYRYEQPQAGRYREHHQFGAEFFGSPLPSFDIEIISMAHDFLREIGFKGGGLTLELNSIGCPTCRTEYNKALRKFLADNTDKLCDDCKRRATTNPLRALDCKVKPCREIYKSAPSIRDYLCGDCKAHHKAVTDGLDAAGISYTETPDLVRGLDYYTRTVFEFVRGGLTLLGGGRYDGLCESLGGKPTPCVGFGCGLERLIDGAEKSGIAFERPAPDVYVAAQCDGARGECARIVRELRDGGLAAETDIMGKSLKAQFKYADRQGYKYVITLGESELESGVYTAKRMADGATYEIRKTDVLGDVRRII